MAAMALSVNLLTELNQIADRWIPAALTLSLLGVSFGLDDMWKFWHGGTQAWEPKGPLLFLVSLAVTYGVVLGLCKLINRRFPLRE